ncbi:MAG: DNA polymerase III subunit delta [Bacteroidetes bacterium]|nr:DNA polymerase III subunit delta [Bacteroidota bacterium]MCL2302860.1 DNA polymerase III subunit delta [Lentimicrobiaceae bacterium]
MTYDQIIAQLQKKQFAPIYFLMGDEPFYIDEISNFIEENAMQEEQRDFNQVLVYGKETDADEVIALAKEFPFGTEKRVVIVKEAKELKNVERLVKYAENPAQTTIVVVCYKYATLRATQLKAAEKNSVIFRSEKMKDYNLSKWILSHVDKYQFKMQPAVAELLAENIGVDLSRIDNELKKLTIFLPPNSEITADIIEKHIGISKEYNVFELKDALAARKIDKAYKIVHYLCQNIKQTPNVQTVNALSSFYLQLLAYNLSDKSIEAKAKVFGSNAFIQKINVGHAQNHSVLELQKIIGILREYDAKTKGVESNLPDEELLKELVYKITH